MSAQAEVLIQSAIGSRDDEGFAALVAEHERRVFQIAVGVLANAADAEEVAQEVFVKAYRNWRSLRDPQRLKAWLNRTAFRLALNRQRARRRQLTRDTAWQAGEPAILDGAHTAEARLHVEHLRKKIEELPEKLRAVLVLCAVEDMDGADVATLLGIPPGTVRSRLHLARKRLLEAWKQ